MTTRTPHPIYDSVIADPDLGGPRGWDPRDLWPNVVIDVDENPPTAQQVAADMQIGLAPRVLLPVTADFDQPKPRDEIQPTGAVTDEHEGVIVNGHIEAVETVPTEGNGLSTLIGIEEVDATTTEMPVSELALGTLTDEELDKHVEAAFDSGDPANPHALSQRLRADGYSVTYYRARQAWKRVSENR